MKRRKSLIHVLHMLLALLVVSGLIYITVFGVDPIPPLGAILNPGTGVWTLAGAAKTVQSETLHFDGLKQPVKVVFEKDGTPHIQAANNDDLFWTIGYLQARFRLGQMDLLRRNGEGRLSEILGKGSLDDDRLQITLGLQRTAETNWRTIAPDSPSHQVLQAYSNGVNALINQEEQNNALPLVFKLLNYKPLPWTPVDTLVVMGNLARQLSFSTGPLDYVAMVKALGYQRTMQWFPMLPPDMQHPYAAGPYATRAAMPVPLPSQLAFDDGTVQNMAALSQQVKTLPAITLNRLASNAWAVDGPKTASGKAIMAGDPHLNLTLPSIWFQMEGDSPDYHFSGASIPGIPTILIGHNQRISWSVTNAANQSTLYYLEKTDQLHPHQYFWNGSWHQMQRISYEIPVKSSNKVQYEVDLTVHGPVIPTSVGIAGKTVTVDWMGALPSASIEALLELVQSNNFAQFRQALSKWVSPTLNFVYADNQGNIGMITPGYYPLIKEGAPWLPLPGTGESDVSGTIPYDAVPQVYNPPQHIVFSANQRPVSNDYPYYIGTTWENFDNGYRADEIYLELSKANTLSTRDMERIQNSTHDYLAGLIVPKLLHVLQQGGLSVNEQHAFLQLQNWNEDMNINSSAASIWWTFWSRYLIDTFGPWWQAKHVPDELAVDSAMASLNEDLEVWTLNNPHNAAFTLPDGTVRDANTVMLQAFKESISELGKTLGNDPAQWQWGKLHTSKIASSTGARKLSYGPYANGGDSWTINAASSGPISISDPTQNSSTFGPSWRMIVDWSSGQPLAEEAYPGGVDENPASSWYETQIAAWWRGQYYPMLDYNTARQQAGSITWTLEG
ncbi:MAG TPA: penicillin acylase family protein [Ktedonobacteraceae bacterium]|nr:penicillin acylase family protein [Ktedonobacteraceae bacterium]